MQHKLSILTVALALGLTLCAAPSLRADDAAPKSNDQPANANNDGASKKDDASKKDTAQPSLDDLLKIPNDKPKDGQPADAAKPDLSPQAMSAKDAADAFSAAVAGMADAAERLRVRQDAGIATQRIQESVLTRLDAVIAAAANNQQNQPNQGAGSQSSQQQQKQEHGDQQNQQNRSKQQGQQQQQAAGGDANKGEFSPGNADGSAAGGNIEETRIEWGQLPQRLRDELDQGLGEKFSPIYKSLTEAFYKRLAEESRD